MLSWLQGKKDVNRLIARGQRGRAIEVLELDKATFESVAAAHPKVGKILRELNERKGS